MRSKEREGTVPQHIASFSRHRSMKWLPEFPGDRTHTMRVDSSDWFLWCEMRQHTESVMLCRISAPYARTGLGVWRCSCKTTTTTRWFARRTHWSLAGNGKREPSHGCFSFAFASAACTGPRVCARGCDSNTIRIVHNFSHAFCPPVSTRRLRLLRNVSLVDC